MNLQCLIIAYAIYSKASFDYFFYKIWSNDQEIEYVYLIKLMSCPDEGDKSGSVQFSNLTSLLQYPFIDRYLRVDHI